MISRTLVIPWDGLLSQVLTTATFPTKICTYIYSIRSQPMDPTTKQNDNVFIQ